MPQSSCLKVVRGIVFGLLLIVGRSAPAVEPSQRENSSRDPYGRGTAEVGATLDEWRDEKRNREVPVKIYAPKSLDAPAPVIVFSHGLGGSRNGYSFLGEHWASRGYVSVHLQHEGSDSEVLKADGKPGGVAAARGKLEAAAANPLNAMQRPRDVSFAIDQLERLNAADGAWKGKLDLTRLGVAGHSFGSWTTMAIAGQKAVLPGGREFSLADPRVKAAIAMSSPTPRAGADLKQTYSGITIPVFHMTGTLDDMPIGSSPAADRRIPFDNTSARDQFLVILTGGDHMVFSGWSPRAGELQAIARGMKGDRALDPEFHALIQKASSAFWDAYLRSDAEAKSWLQGGDLEKLVGRLGTLERK